VADVYGSGIALRMCVEDGDSVAAVRSVSVSAINVDQTVDQTVLVI